MTRPLTSSETITLRKALSFYLEALEVEIAGEKDAETRKHLEDQRGDARMLQAYTHPGCEFSVTTR